jgi:pimeloyl-ACP methyl ester carboxylesterase
MQMERDLAKRPPIAAPSILLYGATDPLARPSQDVTPGERAVFPALVARRVIAGAGHFLPREKPEAVSQALLDLLKS